MMCLRFVLHRDMLAVRKCFECGTILPAQREKASDSSAESDLRHHTLLGSNEPPLDSDLPVIQAIVSQNSTRLACLDTEIAQLRAQLEALEAERKAMSHALAQNRAILSPIRRLPPEVICEIFSFTLPSLSSALARDIFDANDSPWVLTGICHRWRAIAVCTPSLWSLFAMKYSQCHHPFYYPLSAAKIQIQRAQSLKIHFYGSESRDPLPQIEMFRLLIEHSSRWEELSLGLISAMLPLLSSIRGRLPLLCRLWVEWDTVASQAQLEVEGGESFDYFHAAPSLLDVGIYHEFQSIPTSLPVYQLTRYRLDAPLMIHCDILKLAKNLVEAHIDVDFDDEPWPDPVELIDLPYLRRLWVSYSNILDYLKAPSLEEIAVFLEGDECRETLLHLDPFVARSSCSLRALSIKGLPTTASLEILRKYPSIVKFALVIADASFGRDSCARINGLISNLIIPRPNRPVRGSIAPSRSGAAALSPQLSEIYVGCQETAYIDALLYLEMIESRLEAENCPLRTVAFFSHTMLPPRQRARFQALRKQGLELLWLEGPEASDVMEYWTFTEQWN
ncbi:ABC protein [Mycena venus]|uniref:ABC protein n=1 Tax=Mycena venus TaxID=2733690 RepID=A0A8H6XSM8_9AGAR|nr:ABC protein [Mycena venus]